MISVYNLISNLDQCKIKGNKDVDIECLGLCDRKTKHSSILSYVTNDKYVKRIEENSAINAIIVPKKMHAYDQIMMRRNGCVIYSPNPESLFYSVHESLVNKKILYNYYDFNKKIGVNCNIHPLSFVDEGVIIGNNVKIGPYTVINRGTIIEDDVIVGSNTVIGSEGFQIITSRDSFPLHVSHVGGTFVGKGTNIGCNVCISKNLFEDYNYIGRGVMIDNLTYVAHNCHIGDGSVLTAGTIICGSVCIDEATWIGCNSTVLNRVSIGSRTMIGIGSVVTRSIKNDSLAYGTPARVNNKGS